MPFNSDLITYDCKVCTSETTCEYHRGFTDGWDMCAELMAAINPLDPRPNLQIAS